MASFPDRRFPINLGLDTRPASPCRLDAQQGGHDSEQPMTRDRLFLLRPGFEDPAYPGQRFYCWHCALIEGVLGSFPALAEQLDVERIAWPRPRQGVIALVGEENQW